MDIKIAPSLMCANPLKLGEDIQKLEKAGADLLHIDIMDGHFVENLGICLEVIPKVKSATCIPLDVHLMIENPEKYVGRVAEMGADIICFHIESYRYPIRLLKKIKSIGCKAGIVINPSTPIENLKYILQSVDMIVVMTVEPGFSGQKFIKSTLQKITEIRELISLNGLDIDIEVDGNINVDNALRCIKAGANVFVAGTSAVFTQDKDPADNLKEFRQNLMPLYIK